MTNKNKLSSPIYTIIIILLTVWIFIFFDYWWKDNSGINIEYDTEISGIISYTTIDRGNISLRIKRPKEIKYILTVTANYNYNPSDLEEFVRGGDSIYKPSSSDTLYIFRKGKRFYFIINEEINYNK